MRKEGDKLQFLNESLNKNNSLLNESYMNKDKIKELIIINMN
jgi:hypothetical protein